ncbi:MAG: fatty acid oxidation complex subunit alpha FadB [Porticoccaceae bacterium]|nr:fatty acid oxidation complex subunit alpha FadB [Porticoccaceae bacterium]MDG1312190.1 fatty acid oxidation complex subunit alpha FadB [Porticoccaceae bacterium]
MYIGQTLSLKAIENGFVEINFDNQSGSVNVFNEKTLADLHEAVSILASSRDIRGLLLSSGKSVFVVGADITEFSDMFSASKEDFLKGAQHANGIFSQIEDMPFPSVAAINGFALGGGFEVCLACDSRVISSAAAVGLPETGLGILPGWGGTVRLPRLAGFATAVQWVTSGNQQRPEAALAAGAVDAVVAPEALRDESLKLLGELADGSRDYKARRAQKLSPLPEAPEQVTGLSENFQSMIQSKVGVHYPAPLKVVELMTAAATVGRDTAISLENLAFYEISQTPQARALVGLFLNDQAIAKRAKGYAAALSEKPAPIALAGVIGAGIMGGGIAYQNAIRGYSVAMKDIAEPALDLGIQEASKLLGKSVKRGKLSEEGAAQILAKIAPTLDDAAIANCDMVVEAVVELEAVKKKVLPAVEAQLAVKATITSNTSTISINRLAESLERPENFCGMHFFNPVHAMKLVEVIRGTKTSDKTIAAVCNYALGLGKKPIVVNDCPGFLVNRVLFAMTFGLEILLKEGADFQQVDKVMEAWGLPMGPAYLMDVIGIDTIIHCYSSMIEGLPERYIKGVNWPTETIYNAGRLGQKNGLGYYKYELNEKGKPAKVVDPDAVALLESIAGPANQVNEGEIVDRLLISMAMEMVRCLEEGIVSSPAEADMALIYGVGFPAFRGGICRWIDEEGLQSIVERGDKYAHLGELYRPTDKLRAMAANGEAFFS